MLQVASALELVETPEIRRTRLLKGLERACALFPLASSPPSENADLKAALYRILVHGVNGDDPHAVLWAFLRGASEASLVRCITERSDSTGTKTKCELWIAFAVDDPERIWLRLTEAASDGHESLFYHRHAFMTDRTLATAVTAHLAATVRRYTKYAARDHRLVCRSPNLAEGRTLGRRVSDPTPPHSRERIQTTEDVLKLVESSHAEVPSSTALASSGGTAALPTTPPGIKRGRRLPSGSRFERPGDVSLPQIDSMLTMWELDPLEGEVESQPSPHCPETSNDVPPRPSPRTATPQPETAPTPPPSPQEDPAEAMSALERQALNTSLDVPASENVAHTQTPPDILPEPTDVTESESTRDLAPSPSPPVSPPVADGTDVAEVAQTSFIEQPQSPDASSSPIEQKPASAAERRLNQIILGPEPELLVGPKSTTPAEHSPTNTADDSDSDEEEDGFVLISKEKVERIVSASKKSRSLRRRWLY